MIHFVKKLPGVAKIPGSCANTPRFFYLGIVLLEATSTIRPLAGSGTAGLLIHDP